MVAMSLICRDHVGWGELVWVSSYNIVLICSLIIFAHRVFDPLPPEHTSHKSNHWISLPNENFLANICLCQNIPQSNLWCIHIVFAECKWLFISNWSQFSGIFWQILQATQIPPNLQDASLFLPKSPQHHPHLPSYLFTHDAVWPSCDSN